MQSNLTCEKKISERRCDTVDERVVINILITEADKALQENASCILQPLFEASSMDK